VAQGGSAAGSRYAVFGLPDIEAFQLPIAITAAQNTWDQTTLGWLDRQDELRNWMSRFTTANAAGAGADFSVGSKPEGVDAARPGFWLKAIGSWTNRHVSRGLGDIVPAASVLGNFNLGYNQDSYGIVGGVDSSKETIFTPADAAVVGVMGGYIHSNLNFKQSPTSFRFTGGTVGASFIYLNSGWFADGLVKADLLNLNMNFPTLGEFGSAGTAVGATNLGGLVDFGYRWDGSAGFWSAGYVEPIGTLSYVRTHFDNFSLSGLTAKLGPGESFRGAVGVRGGNIWMSTPEYEVESSVTAKVWDQFSTQNGVTLQVSDLTLNDRYSKVFGELTGQINVTSNASGWSGYVRSGAKFNTQFSTVYAKAGVTYQW
jgi:outer membrane autotransporter protein